MALKSNSKQALANIRSYIMTAAEYIECEYNGDVYNNEDLTTYKGVARAVFAIFKAEKSGYLYRMNTQALFEEWASGLALNLFDYYYEGNANSLLAGFLEQTEAEAAKYSEADSEKQLTYLIFREVSKA